MLGYGKTGHEDDPEIAENQQCTRTEPGQWTGNTDSRIAILQ